MASANVAPPPGLVIEWEAPPDCPNDEQVRGAVWAAVGSTRLSRAANVTARAVVTRGPSGGFTMRLAIETDGASETKTVDAESCATLADAYAVIVAFRIDPESATNAQVHVEPPKREAEPSAPLPRARVLRLGAGPVLAASAGVLPFPAYGFGVAAEAEYVLRWSLGATYWPPEPAWAPDSRTSHLYGAAVQLVSVQPSACVPVARGVLAFCGGVDVGAMSASGRGTGVVSPRDGSAWWLAFSAGVEVEVPVARFLAVRVRLDGGVPALRSSFGLDPTPAGTEIAYQPDLVFALLRIEPLFRFFSTDSAETRHDPR